MTARKEKITAAVARACAAIGQMFGKCLRLNYKVFYAKYFRRDKKREPRPLELDDDTLDMLLASVNECNKRGVFDAQDRLGLKLKLNPANAGASADLGARLTQNYSSKASAEFDDLTQVERKGNIDSYWPSKFFRRADIDEWRRFIDAKDANQAFFRFL